MEEQKEKEYILMEILLFKETLNQIIHIKIVLKNLQIIFLKVIIKMEDGLKEFFYLIIKNVNIKDNL
jgi:hypothetical protein